MARRARLGPRPRGRRARPLPDRAADRRGAPLRRAPALLRHHGLREHDPASEEQAMPGEPGLEHRIRSHHPLERAGDGGAGQPRRAAELGGHIASFASAATLYDVGFNHFFRAPDRETTAATSSTSRATRSPGIYARAFLEGRLSEEQLRQLPARGRRRRALLLSAPVADAGLLAVPDGLDGPRPDAWRSTRRASCSYLQNRGMLDAAGTQGLGLPGRRRDGRARVARRDRARRAREARQPDLRGELQPAAPRRTGARQRQDHPGARGRPSAAPAGTSSR